MAFTKLSNADFNDNGALSMPNRPSETKSAQEIKRLFDAPAREVVAPAYNRLIDELEAETGAASLGAVAPTGASGNTVQEILNGVYGAISTAVVDVREIKDEIEELSEEVGTFADDIETLQQEAHTHSNKALLDTYTQTESNLRDAVDKTHTHANKATLDLIDSTTKGHYDTAYTNTHTHANKTVLDKFGESSGQPTYDGNPIGGGGGGAVNNAYKNVKVGSTTITASGEDTIELVAGSNVTLTPDASLKKVTIAASGGGSSTGDMLASDYDSDFAVKTAGGIKSYVTTAISGKADSASLATVATSGSYNDLSNKPTIPAAQVNSDWNASSGVSQILNKPTIPTVDQNYSSVSTNAQSGTAVASAVSGKANSSDLDEWTGTQSVSSGSVTFSGIDDSAGTNGYETFCNITSNSTNKNPSFQVSSISGAGTSSMSITYTTDADEGASVKLRIIK